MAHETRETPSWGRTHWDVMDAMPSPSSRMHNNNEEQSKIITLPSNSQTAVAKSMSIPPILPLLLPPPPPRHWWASLLCFHELQSVLHSSSALQTTLQLGSVVHSLILVFSFNGSTRVDKRGFLVGEFVKTVTHAELMNGWFDFIWYHIVRFRNFLCLVEKVKVDEHWETRNKKQKTKK